MNSTPDPKHRLRNHLLGSRSDRLLLLLVLGTIAWGWMHIGQLAGNGAARVDIYRGQTLLAEYPLHGAEPVRFEAEGAIGVSEVLIADGEVAITDSPCSTKKCVLSGHRHRIGDMLVCLPNRILVTIRGDAQGFDAMLE